MDKEIFESHFMQIKDIIRNKFGNLTEEDLRTINGRYDNLLLKLEERYGLSRDQAEGELHRFLLDRFPNFFTAEKLNARPLRSDIDLGVRREEKSSALKWLALAGIPLLLALGFLIHDNSKIRDDTIGARAVPKAGEEMVVKNVKPADQALSLAIRDALAADALVAPDLPNISIDASNGVVTISGTVPSVQDRDEVLKVVQESSGGQQINNLLEVRSS